jgi:hypothetical protein
MEAAGGLNVSRINGVNIYVDRTKLSGIFIS